MALRARELKAHLARMYVPSKAGAYTRPLLSST
jgi:hypothetical protein